MAFPAPRVIAAMRYAVLGEGKRLRPFLVVESAALFGVPRERALRAGAALECVHCYSLVHDDLPAMDDDDLRRGKPTAHRAFDEATAILAGDALLTFAFEILSDPATHPDAAVRLANWSSWNWRRPPAWPAWWAGRCWTSRRKRESLQGFPRSRSSSP
jgi:farnesyl diphosphate synthase